MAGSGRERQGKAGRVTGKGRGGGRKHYLGLSFCFF